MKNGEWRMANGESAMRARPPAQRKQTPSAIRHPPSAIGSALLAAVLAAACGDEPVTAVPGDPKAGRAALQRYQCGACHSIPGIAGANGLVGPPLSEYGQRVYIAGKFPKEPALLAKWIQDAPALAPQTAMPNVGVTEVDARDIAAYLYQLR
jgi:cytochrome c